MDLDGRLTARVGAAALFVLAGAIVFFVFISNRIEWGRHVRVHVYMHQTGNLREGAPLIAGGRTIGKVEAIALSPQGAKTPLGGDEGIDITVAIDAGWADRLSSGGDVFVASRGALSERYLELGPAKEPGPPFAEGQQILGRDPPSLDRVLNRTWDNLQTAARFADAVRPETRRLREALDRLFGHAADLEPPGPLRDGLTDLVAQARQAYETGLGGDAGIARARALIGETRIAVVEMRAMLDRIQARVTELRLAVAAMQGRVDARVPPLLDSLQQAIDRGKEAIDKIDPLLAVVDEITDRLARGEGTIGKLATDPEFPEDAKDLGKLLKRQPWKIIGHPEDKR